MTIAVTGATGSVGHWIAAHLLAAGLPVVALGRRPSRHAGAAQRSFDLDGPAPDLSGVAVLVHAALAHVPGRYRGGEGDDPDGFRRRNLDGTRRLFGAARAAGVGRILFLSSRAVYGDGPGAGPPGTLLDEARQPRPDTLYGAVKLAAEQALADMAGPGLAVASLRATGVYGPPVPGLAHKWDAVLAAHDRGDPTPPRAGTEVHAADLAEAVRMLALAPAEALAPQTFNVSDIVLDRRDLLARWAAISGRRGPLPDRADAAALKPMATPRLQALGWRPRGAAGIDPVLRALAARSLQR